MSDEMNVDVSADSSSAQSGADPSQATSQSASQAPAQQPKGFHEHPDWQRMVASRREDRALVSQLQQKIAAFERSQQAQPGSQQTYSPEELQAINALKRLLAGDPELKAVLDLAKKSPQFEQRFQGMDQFQAQAARAHTSAARSHIKELAAAENLPTDDASLRHIVRLVAGEAMQLDNGNERYASGDMSVLEEAFQSIKPWLSGLRKPAEQTVAQTKNKLKQLPPPMRGSTAGEPAPKKLEQGKEREFEADMHKRAKERLSQLLQG
jgi:hypothetical protein